MQSSVEAAVVRKITGTSAEEGVDRRVFTKVQPSIMGMSTSLMTRSGGLSRADWSALGGSKNAWIAYSPRFRMVRTRLCTSRSSSTTMIRETASTTQVPFLGDAALRFLRSTPDRRSLDRNPPSSDSGPLPLLRSRFFRGTGRGMGRLLSSGDPTSAGPGAQPVVTGALPLYHRALQSSEIGRHEPGP